MLSIEVNIYKNGGGGVYADSVIGGDKVASDNNENGAEDTRKRRSGERSAGGRARG